MAKDVISITSTKSSFLTSQTRLLSAPLQLSAQYRSSLYSSDSALSSKAVSDIVAKTNDRIHAHNRQVFSAQSIRHVAEQIETLYWNEAKEDLRADTDGLGEGGYVAVEKDVELSEGGIEVLPEELEEALLDERHAVDVEDAERYAQLRRQLTGLAAKRNEARKRLERYQGLQELLRPYEHPQENIQPNLVTKDGEMSKELDRMRVLLARVSARMGEHSGPPQEKARNEVKNFDQKLAELMEIG